MKNKKEVKILAHPHFQKQMGLKPSKECRPLKECFKEAEEIKEKWYMKYFYYPFHWYIVNPYIEVRYFIKCFIQRRIRGFDDGDFWSFDITFKNWWRPRFNRFIKIYGSEYYKPYGTSQKQWEKAIEMISWWLNESDKDYWNVYYGGDKKKYNLTEYSKRENKAIKLLKKHLFDFSI